MIISGPNIYQFKHADGRGFYVLKLDRSLIQELVPLPAESDYRRKALFPCAVS